MKIQRDRTLASLQVRTHPLLLEKSKFKREKKGEIFARNKGSRKEKKRVLFQWQYQ